MERKILHVDMDCFYASIEMRDEPTLRDKPVVIARDPRKNGGHGVVATANYEARKYGIHSAQNAQKALKLCPKAVFVTPDFEKYRRISRQIHEIFAEFSDLVEPIAFDEAYLDITADKKGLGSATLTAHLLQQEIYAKTQLTCSVGISYNKFLAKLASDFCKPVGTTLVRKSEVQAFLFPLPIEKFRGVGKKTAPKMHALGIKTGRDLYEKSERYLYEKFGKIGTVLYQRVRGIDERPVELKERKSIGTERTFIKPLLSEQEVSDELFRLAKRLVSELNTKQKHGKTLVLKLRTTTFETVTKRVTKPDFLANDVDLLVYYAQELLDEITFASDLEVRLLGLTVTNLAPLEFENISLPLFKFD
ncbi:MAG: DNA polymerase IV [Lactobacillus sp.]|nr:DNA polymerase IV [Lactobacillus sp.]